LKKSTKKRLVRFAVSRHVTAKRPPKRFKSFFASARNGFFLKKEVPAYFFSVR